MDNSERDNLYRLLAVLLQEVPDHRLPAYLPLFESHGAGWWLQREIRRRQPEELIPQERNDP